MIKLKEIKFSEFVNLVKFLQFDNDENEFYNILKRLTRFIKDLNEMKAIQLGNIIKEILNDNTEKAENDYNVYLEQYGDLEVDPEGRLDLTPIQYYEISLQSCELLFERALSELEDHNFHDDSPNKINLQIYNAKTLKPLIDSLNKDPYLLKRALYFKNKNVAISMGELKEIEDNLKTAVPDNYNNVLCAFINYIFNKMPINVHFFIEHFKTRLSVLVKDKEKIYDADREFYENLMKID